MLRKIECEALKEFLVGVNNLLLLGDLDFVGCRTLKMRAERFGKLTKHKILLMIKCEALEEFCV